MNLLEEKLQEIGDILNNKFSGYFTFTSRNTSFNCRFPTPLKLNPSRNYEIALHYISTSNHMTNITEKNNKFIYSHDNGKTWTTIAFEKGAYEMKQIDEEIKRQMAANKHYDDKVSPPNYFINIGVNLSTFKAFIDITNPTFKVNFQEKNTIRDLLGFKSKIISQGHNISDNTVEITKSSAILLHCDLVSGSYINGVESNLLYSFPSYLVQVGYKINVFSSNMIYLPTNRKVISNIHFKLTDEDFNILDLKGEEIVIAVHIRQV